MDISPDNSTASNREQITRIAQDAPALFQPHEPADSTRDNLVWSPLIHLEFESNREFFENEISQLEARHLAARPYGPGPADSLPRDEEPEFQKPNNILTRILERYFEVRFERPPKGRRFYDQDRFIRQAKPYVMEETSDHAPLLFYGGINSTGYSWKQLATMLHLQTGARAEVYSLKGHEGRWKNFLEIKHTDWAEDIIQRALDIREKTGKLPIGFGQSTGALAMALANQIYAERNDGARLFAGIVFSGPPIALKRTSHRISLSILDKLYAKDPDALIWRHMSAKTDMRRALESRDRDELRNPSTTYIPVKALLELWRLMGPGIEAFKKVNVPTLVIQGKNLDHLVSWKPVRSAFNKMVSEDKTAEFWAESSHSPMFGATKYQFWNTVMKWIAARQDKFEEISLLETRRDIASLINQRISELQIQARETAETSVARPVIMETETPVGSTEGPVPNTNSTATGSEETIVPILPERKSGSTDPKHPPLA